MIALVPIVLVAQAEPQWLDDARGGYGRFAEALQVEPSATALLKRWCEGRGLADPAEIRAEVDRGANVPPSAEQRTRLKVGPDEKIAYRRVRLMCGAYVLSEAENWYVPGRLNGEILAQLDGDTPFGAAIRPLDPRRVTIGTARLWNGKLPVPQAILRQQALVLDGDGQPLAEVRETYQKALIVPVE